MTTPTRLYADLIGVPFREGGRDAAGLDCWGVLHVLQRRMGNAPTDFPTDPSLLAQAIADEWAPVDLCDLSFGDGILLRSNDSRYVWHIGAFVAPGFMLHARESAGVVCERFDSPAYARRIVGFYRFRG